MRQASWGPRARRPRWIALVLVLLLTTTACSTTLARQPAAVSTKAPLELAVWVGPSPTLHPHQANPQVTAALFSPLVVIDPESRLPTWGPDVPGALLESVSSEDLRRWDVVVKEGWTWHDGTPVVAEDVARGWQAAIEAGLPIVSTVTDIRVRDKATLSFALAAPYGQLPALLANEAFLPLPPMAIDDPARFAEAPVGNGVYRLAGRQGDALVLDAVFGHPAGTAASDRLLAVRTDQPAADQQVVVVPDGVLTLPGDADRPHVVRAPGRQLAYLGFPLTDPRFADPDVRVALSQAIDRQALVELLPEGAVVPADRLLGPGMARSDGPVCTACVHDPDRAAELWSAPDGPLSLWYAADAGHDEVIDAIAGAWSTMLGVDDIQLATLPAEDLLARLAQAEVPGPFRLTWAADAASPSRLLEPLFGPRGSANDFRYRADGIGDLLATADLQRDLEEALDAYATVEQQVLDDLPLVPLWFSTVGVAMDENITAGMDGRGLLDWASVERS